MKVAHLFRQVNFEYLQARKACDMGLNGKGLFQVEKMQISGEKMQKKVNRTL